MMSGTTKTYSHAVLLSVALQTLCVCVVRGESTFQKRYWTGTSNIVATVSAYERMTRLSSGENVPSFSTSVDDLCTNYSAIVFCVIAPTNYAGKFFRLKAIPPEPLSGYLPPAYNIGKLYYFCFSDSTDPSSGIKYWVSINSGDLFSMSDGGDGRLNVGKITGDIYYPSTQEAVRVLRDLEDERIKLMEKINSFSNQLEKAKLANELDINKDPQLRRLKGQFLDIKMGRVPCNEYKQKEVKMQIEQLKQLEKGEAP